MQDPIRELVYPTPVHLAIVWRDGTESVFTWAGLRRACHCASCVDEITGRALLDPGTVPEDLGCRRVSRVGNYGLQFEFGDGHSTGIYPYERLRSPGSRPSSTEGADL